MTTSQGRRLSGRHRRSDLPMMLAALDEAIETLRRNLHSPSHAVQVRAARALAELAL